MLSVASMFTEEILVKIFSYTPDKRGVVASAGTCRHWRSIIRGPRSTALIRNLFDANYPTLLQCEAAAALNNAGLFDLFLRTERLRLLAGKKLRPDLATAIKSMRESDELLNTSYAPAREPYA
jgi:hypothetical protein